MRDPFFDAISKGFQLIQGIPKIAYQYNDRKLVFQQNKTKLYHYRSTLKNLALPPLLIVFATINRPEILELYPKRSFIGSLLKKGMELYLLDWGYPDSKDKDLSFDDYFNNLKKCIEFIVDTATQKKINLLGVCQGGLFCLCYATLYQQIKNLILISTPVDFHTTDNLLSQLVNKVNIDNWSGNNISGSWLNQFFISMRLFELTGKKYLKFVDNIEDRKATEKFLRIEKWLYDTPDQSGKAFAEFIYHFYQKNQLIQSEIVLNNKKINLKELTIPILNIVADKDTIVPKSASCDLNKYISSTDYTQKVYSGGHIGIYVNEKIQNKMTMEIMNWLKKRS